MGGMFQNASMKAIYNPLGTSNPFKAALDPLGMFSKPEVPTPVTPPPAPTLDNQQSGLDQMALMQARQLQAGRTATILNGGGGLASAGSTSKVLLGQ